MIKSDSTRTPSEKGQLSEDAADAEAFKSSGLKFSEEVRSQNSKAESSKKKSLKGKFSNFVRRASTTTIEALSLNRRESRDTIAEEITKVPLEQTPSMRKRTRRITKQNLRLLSEGPDPRKSSVILLKQQCHVSYGSKRSSSSSQSATGRSNSLTSLLGKLFHRDSVGSSCSPSVKGTQISKPVLALDVSDEEEEEDQFDSESHHLERVSAPSSATQNS
jgi:hypothetical protein